MKTARQEVGDAFDVGFNDLATADLRFERHKVGLMVFRPVST